MPTGLRSFETVILSELSLVAALFDQLSIWLIEEGSILCGIVETSFISLLKIVFAFFVSSVITPFFCEYTNIWNWKIIVLLSNTNCSLHCFKYKTCSRCIYTDSRERERDREKENIQRPVDLNQFTVHQEIEALGNAKQNVWKCEWSKYMRDMQASGAYYKITNFNYCK